MARLKRYNRRRTQGTRTLVEGLPHAAAADWPRNAAEADLVLPDPFEETQGG